MTQSISTTKNKAKRSRNTTLDVMRIILACLVVYIHLDNELYNRHGLGSLSLIFDDIVLILARIAVPLFFAISGYCLYRGHASSERISAKKSLRHLSLLAMGTIILYIIVGTTLNGPFQTANAFTPKNLFEFVIIGRSGPLLGAGDVMVFDCTNYVLSGFI